MSATSEIKVLIVDDHKMFVDGLAAALTEQPDMKVVGTAATGAQALAAVEAHEPDVVLLDQILPDCDGIDAAYQMIVARPLMRIIVISQLVDADIAQQAVAAGCAGYVTKDKPVAELVAAIRAASSDEPVMSPDVLRKIFERMRAPRTAAFDLSNRESEILQLMADGLSTAAIADELTVSLSTIRNHVYSVTQKLGAHSKLEAVLIAMREGLVRPPRPPRRGH